MKKSNEFGLKAVAVVVLATAVSGSAAAQKSNWGLSPGPIMRSGSSTTQYYTTSLCGTPQMTSLNETAVTTCGSSTAFATNEVRIKGGALVIRTVASAEPAPMHLGLAAADAHAVFVVPHGQKMQVKFTVTDESSIVGITEANTQSAWYYQDDGSQELLPGIYTISAASTAMTSPGGDAVFSQAEVRARLLGSAEYFVLHVPEHAEPMRARGEAEGQSLWNFTTRSGAPPTVVSRAV